MEIDNIPVLKIPTTSEDSDFYNAVLDVLTLYLKIQVNVRYLRTFSIIKITLCKAVFPQRPVLTATELYPYNVPRS